MMDIFLRYLRVAVGGHDYSREGALWWSRRELPQPAGLLGAYYGLGFSQTLEKYGYCWIEPRIDWTLLKFLPDNYWFSFIWQWHSSSTIYEI
jgi:hypothetical protein